MSSNSSYVYEIPFLQNFEEMPSFTPDGMNPEIFSNVYIIETNTLHELDEYCFNSFFDEEEDSLNIRLRENIQIVNKLIVETPSYENFLRTATIGEDDYLYKIYFSKETIIKFITILTERLYGKLEHKDDQIEIFHDEFEKEFFAGITDSYHKRLNAAAEREREAVEAAEDAALRAVHDREEARLLAEQQMRERLADFDTDLAIDAANEHLTDPLLQRLKKHGNRTLTIKKDSDRHQFHHCDPLKEGGPAFKATFYESEMFNPEMVIDCFGSCINNLAIFYTTPRSHMTPPTHQRINMQPEHIYVIQYMPVLEETRSAFTLKSIRDKSYIIYIVKTNTDQNRIELSCIYLIGGNKLFYIWWANNNEKRVELGEITKIKYTHLPDYTKSIQGQAYVERLNLVPPPALPPALPPAFPPALPPAPPAAISNMRWGGDSRAINRRRRRRSRQRRTMRGGRRRRG